ncbi:50S ribosomal protein L11 [Candidatus Pacearchaeota archaeon]|nr:50S ribosomal protein L11 [Candidatus Pacearchaeota archaeon]
MKVKLIVDGGDMKPGPAVAQQLGPMGINLGKVIADVNTATHGFKGMKAPVEIDVDAKTKSYKIKVFSPPVAELIKKEINAEKGSGEAKTTKVGNIALERIISIAQTKMSNLLAKNLKSAVKLVVGTCVSLGVLVDNKEAKDIEKDIDSGKYDHEIKNAVTEPSAEKKADLARFFAIRKAEQEKAKKALEEAKAAEEAAKAAAAAATPGATPAAPGATPAAPGATPAAPAAEKKEAAKAPEKKPAKK